MFNRIYLDVDGVLADFMKEFLLKYNKVNCTNFKHQDITTWSLEEGFLRKDEKWTDYLDSTFILNLEVLPWAEELVQAVCNTGIDFAFLTNISSKHEFGMEYRRRWLNKSFPFIKEAGDLMICAQHKDLVATTGDLLIDDSPHNIKAVMKKGAMGITLAQPWNSGAPNRRDPEDIVELLSALKN